MQEWNHRRRRPQVALCFHIQLSSRGRESLIIGQNGIAKWPSCSGVGSVEEVGAAPPPASFRPPQQLHLKQQQQRGSRKRCFLSGSSHLSSTMKLSCANLSSRSPPAASMGLVVAPDCGGLDVASPAPPFLSGSTEQPFGPQTQQMHVSAPPASRRSEEAPAWKSRR